MSFKLKLLIWFLPIILLAACGGGGSDSGGGSSGKNTQKFRGTEIISLSFRGARLKRTGKAKLIIEISGNAVTVIDIDGNRFTGELQINGTFVATGTQPVGKIADGVECEDIVLRYFGAIIDNKISGSSEGSAVCTTKGGTAAAVQKSTFSVSL